MAVAEVAAATEPRFAGAPSRARCLMAGTTYPEGEVAGWISGAHPPYGYFTECSRLTWSRSRFPSAPERLEQIGGCRELCAAGFDAALFGLEQIAARVEGFEII